MSWTEERVAELTKLWESGYSASQIGKILGVSKNSVVGKAHRMKLKSRPSPIKRDGIRKARPRKKPVLITPKAAPQPAVPRPAPIIERRTTGKGPKCLWPIGDPGDPDFHFCGCDAEPGKPYCAPHCAVAYITKTRNDSQAA